MTDMHNNNNNNNFNIILKALGPRALVTVEEAISILDGWKVQIDSGDSEARITIDIRCRKWPLDTLNVFKEFFISIADRVNILILDDIIASLKTEDGLASLNFFSDIFYNSPLEEFNCNDNATGSRGVEVLKPLLIIPTVKTLLFNNNGMSLEVAEELLTILILSKAYEHLEVLDLGRNQIGLGAKHTGQLISKCKKLRTFNYDGSRPQAEGTGYLLEGLLKMVEVTGNISLVELNLKDCTFDDGSEEDHPVHYLCKLLRLLPNLMVLIVGDGNLGQDGAQRVYDALSEANVQLVKFDIGGNDVEEGVDGVTPLVDFLQGGGDNNQPQSQLEELVVDSNIIGDDGLKALLTGIPPSLRKLSLDGNCITRDGGQALLDAKNENEDGRLTNLETIILTDNGYLDDEDNDDLIVEMKAAFTTVWLDRDVDAKALRDAEEAKAGGGTAAAEQEEVQDEEIDELTQQMSQLG